jgi:hypothetical protein
MSEKKSTTRPVEASESGAGMSRAQNRKRSSQNARRHGLSAPVSVGSADWQRIQDLATAFYGKEQPEGRGWDIAQNAACAHLALEKIQALKASLLDSLACALSTVPLCEPTFTGKQPSDRGTRPLDQILLELQALGVKLRRYEIRAFSRRSRALECLTGFAISQASTRTHRSEMASSAKAYKRANSPTR